MIQFRDAAEARIADWRDTLFDEGARSLLARLPDDLAEVVDVGPSPAFTVDVGEVLELADVLCIIGLLRDDRGGRALAAARACYQEVERWPNPWPVKATRSAVSAQLRESSPQRLSPKSLSEEIASLERAQAAPLAERPWFLAELYWTKLKKEWGYAIQAGDHPSLDRVTSLAVLYGMAIPELGSVTTPELGAVLATVSLSVQTDFVEATAFTREDRTSLAREFIDRVRAGTPHYTSYILAELELHSGDVMRKGACQAALALLPERR